MAWLYAIVLTIGVCIANVRSATVMHVPLSPKYSLSYRMDEKAIVFKMVAETSSSGWIGLGFNDHPEMKGANVVVAGLNDGKKYCYDMHATGHERPVMNDVQSYKLLKSSQNGTHTVLYIGRYLQTGNNQDFKLSAGQKVHVLWAIGPKAAKGPADFDIHADRGVKEVTL